MNLDLFRRPTDPVGVKREQADGIPLLVGFGGGVNSTAALILLRDMGIRPDLVTFADTRGEKPETYAYLAVMDAWLAGVGFPPLTIVANPSPVAGHTSLENACLVNQTLPSRAFGGSSCAQRWKIEPQDNFVKAWAPAQACWASGRKPLKVLGYDGDEERRTGIVENKLMRFWYPLFERGIDRDGCDALIRREGLPVPPKSACFFCPSSKKHEVLALAKEHPDLFARALVMEDWARANAEYPLESVRGLGRQWSWRELHEADAATRARFAEQPVESCLVCVDQSEAS